jgi:hypothetical protein
MQVIHVYRLCVPPPQGKLEAEQRQQLIEKGQQLKVQLEGIESKLVQVRDG